MRVIDVLNAPWAIAPEKLLEIREIYLRHADGEKVDLVSIEAQLNRRTENQFRGLEIVDGVAILPIEGVLAKRMNLFTEISGGTSTELLARDFQRALNLPEVHSILLQIDSPGGQVDGIQELARMVREARGIKPIVALGSSAILSAAYWVGSSADKVFITGDTTAVGSIGVVATHVDKSRAEEQRGLKVTEISAGEFKRRVSDHRPLTPDGFQAIKDQVDFVYSVVVEDVARNRGVSVDTVLENMADGRVFLGKQAIDAGLVDGIATQDQVIESLNEKHQAGPRLAANAGHSLAAYRAEANRLGLKLEKEAIMDRITLTTEELNQKLQAEFTRGSAEAIAARKAEGEASKAEAKAEGAREERDRIQGIEAIGLPGHEALVQELKFDGKTSPAEASQKIVAAEKAKREQKLESLKGQAPKPAPAASVPETSGIDPNLPLEERCKLEWEQKAEVREEFRSPEAYTAYCRAAAEGRARILGDKRPV